MKRILIHFTLLLVFACSGVAAQAQTTEINGAYSGTVITSSDIVLNGATITFSKVSITCNKLTIESNVAHIIIEGNVQIQCKEIIFANAGSAIILDKSDGVLSIQYENNLPATATRNFSLADGNKLKFKFAKNNYSREFNSVFSE